MTDQTKEMLESEIKAADDARNQVMRERKNAERAAVDAVRLWRGCGSAIHMVLG